MIRPALEEDMDSILAVYETARHRMAQNGNPFQWGTNYPERRMLQDDIALRQLFVEEEGGRICAVFMFRIGEDPTYALIKNGAWKNDEPYGTIHRVASDGQTRGAFSRCLGFCKGLIGNIRIDTHADNLIMRRLIEKHGFEYCGVIFTEDGSPRLAYQYTG